MCHVKSSPCLHKRLSPQVRIFYQSPAHSSHDNQLPRDHVNFRQTEPFLERKVCSNSRNQLPHIHHVNPFLLACPGLLVRMKLVRPLPVTDNSFIRLTFSTPALPWV